MLWVLDDTDRGADMNDPFTIHRIGLPEPILHALSPRPVPAEGTARDETPTPGAVFTPTAQDAQVRGEEPLLTELRMLAELHRTHQASESSSQAA
jgi:hypothetical protein